MRSTVIFFFLLLMTRALGKRELAEMTADKTGRTGSLAVFEVAAPSASDRWRILAQLPWFGRNLAVKVLLRLRLRRVARLLGHVDAADPY